MKYFWIGNSNYKVGDIVNPGNWGNLVLQIPNHRWLKMELQFEAARLRLDPNLPSRLQALFLFQDIKTAKILHKTRLEDSLFQVELLNPDNKVFVTDMALVHPELEIYNAHIGNPLLYWKERHLNELQLPEVLTLSPAKIIKTLKVKS